MKGEADFLRFLDAFLSAPYVEREAAEDAARARADGRGFVTCQGCGGLVALDAACDCAERVAA